jgi:hypothetical protein
MKRLKILCLCLCLILSSVSFANGKEARRLESSLTVAHIQNEIPNIFRPIGKLLKWLFRRETKAVPEQPTASVELLTLSRDQITASCNSSDLTQSNSCFDKSQVEILTQTNYDQLGNINILKYVYKVSAGQIIGEGANVILDLSGVEPGTYTITAGVDDGCGVCGKTQTKEVKVVKCPNCN